MKPGPFTDAAMMLVNGNDPKLLAVALAEYSRLIGSRRPNKDDDKNDDALLSPARAICAAVCAEAWRHYHHGQVHPYSSKLQEACEVYWQACGKDASGSIRNWERSLLDFVAANDEEFRKNFLHYITIPK
jgi:hypothetical protein